MDASDKEFILTAIAHEEERLKKLTHEQEQALSRIQTLRDKLLSYEAIGNVRELPAEYFKISLTPKNSTEKVALFRSLFRGCEDVFPRLWISRAGKKGYAPACLNDWAAGVCGKTLTPPVKCGESSNRKFLPVTDQTILDHLQGRHIIGIYPMLENDTCWFLAADFDKESWMEDVHAFRETCRSMDIPIAVERSRPGNGAHVWFFFTEAISAAVARAMGCFLITETMSNCHQLSMESYDRLFPSQDMLPKGGFGNLIALPLQHESRQKGNTVFLDQDFKPYEDQWNYLASLRRVELATVHQIASDAIQREKVLGMPRAITEDEGETTPWNRLPSRKALKELISGILPEKIHVVVSQQIFVEKKDLSSPLINRIKRLAAFQNPEFYQKQNMRLSTALTPRVITCFEELPDHLALPRGCMDELRGLLSDH